MDGIKAAKKGLFAPLCSTAIFVKMVMTKIKMRKVCKFTMGWNSRNFRRNKSTVNDCLNDEAEHGKLAGILIHGPIENFQPGLQRNSETVN